MIVGAYVGATVFVLLRTDEFFGGPGLMVWSLAGAVALHGCWRWSDQTVAWRAFIVVCIAAGVLTLLGGTSAGKAQFAAWATGLVMAFGWLSPDMNVQDEAA